MYNRKTSSKGDFASKCDDFLKISLNFSWISSSLVKYNVFFYDSHVSFTENGRHCYCVV